MSALILISVLGVVLLYLGFGDNRKWLAPVGILGLLAALTMLLCSWNVESPLFAGMLKFDGYAMAFDMSLILLTVLLFLFGIDYYARMRENVAEQYALMLFSLVGGLMLTSFTNLLVLFLGIEILSIPLFILAGGKRDSFRSGEAAFKYFLQGSFASGFLLLGIASDLWKHGLVRPCDGASRGRHPPGKATCSCCSACSSPSSVWRSRWPLCPSTSGAPMCTKAPQHS
ncbi:MAG: hypothetical protein IPP83_18750 [Flavobacteriales bacterium]|nr:hypothetical protein [Flavobacteriales bacterium]